MPPKGLHPTACEKRVFTAVWSFVTWYYYCADRVPNSPVTPPALRCTAGASNGGSESPRACHPGRAGSGCECRSSPNTCGHHVRAWQAGEAVGARSQ